MPCNRTDSVVRCMRRWIARAWSLIEHCASSVCLGPELGEVLYAPPAGIESRFLCRR
jgi:hypothetical protein